MTEQELADRKAAIIADECRFQRACGKLVSRGVIQRASSLMYDIGQNLEAACKLFDLDYDETMGWFQQDDWREPVEEFVRNDADLDDLEWIADEVGYWTDVPEVIEYLNYEGEQDRNDAETIDLEDWLKLPANEGKEAQLREAVIALITSDDEYREIAEHFRIDPYTHEVYEHWIVDSWFAARLRECGEVVFDFADFTIWGRCATGQAILLDAVVREICKEQEACSYIWED